MRPTPAELVEHVRRILRDVVEPEVASEYARARLHEVRTALAQLDWDNAGLDLARDTEALRELLAEVASWASSDDERREHFAGELPALTAVAAEGPPDPADRFATHQDRRTRYAALAVRLVDPMADWLTSHPDDDVATRLNHDLLTGRRDT